MIKRYFHKAKGLFVSVTGNWFYPIKKLPIGTHIYLFLKYRVEFEPQVVFDVGANIGGFSRNLSFHYPNSSFYCFEPFPKTFESLKLNVKRNNFKLYQLGLGDQPESIFVNENPINDSFTNTLIKKTNSTGSKNTVSIQITTLDEFCRSQSINTIDLLKIDTEGFDLKVLKGAKKMLEQGNVKLIYVECGLDPSNSYHVFFPEILSFLNSMNFVFIGFFQTDIRKVDRKIHFSNALFVGQSFLGKVKTY